jgi:hypothetical protein
MKVFCILAFLLTCCFSAFSQSDDVVIMSSDTSDSTAKIFNYRGTDNSEDGWENYHEHIANSHRFNNSSYLTKGWRIFCEFGVQKAFDRYTCSVLDFSFSIGWQLNPYVYFGIGVGEQAYLDHWYYGTYDESATLALVLPLYMDLRFDFLDRRITPFLDLRYGYSATDDEYNDYSGMYINPSVGVRLCKVNLSFGPEFVKLHYPWNVKTVNKNGAIECHDIKFQASYMFKISYEWGGTF